MLIVYHVASMGNWREVVDQQLDLLVKSGLQDFPLYFTHVGPQSDADWLMKTAKVKGLNPTLDRTDENILHYETFASLLIERLAKQTDEPIMYFHTKGVSAHWHEGKRKWRAVMEREVIAKWREHLPDLLENRFDAVGVNWCQWNDPHFSGNFWIARADWIRKLPDYVAYHHSKECERTSCEFWIGSAPGIRPKTLLCSGHSMWYDDYDWGQWFARKVNLGCGAFPMAGWLNVDIRPDVKPDLVADIATLEFEDNSVAEVYCGHLLEHVADPLSLIQRCHRWLRAGGRLTMTVPDFGKAALMYHGQMPNDPTYSGDRIAFGLTEPPEQRHLQAFTPATLIPLFKLAGFKNVKTMDPCPHWVAHVPWQFSVTGEK